MSMMHRVATTTKGPPTQLMRWCCEVYKENGGNGYTKIIGVRAAESVRRAKRWRMVTAKREGGTIICPIVYWTDKDVWDYHRRYNLPYCELYDQGLKRLGCIGCPMAGVKGTKRDFELWPLYARNWERAVKAHWQKYHDIPRRDGNPRAQAGFSSAEEYWQWWVSRSRRRKETGCELGFIFT
jgi:phosphoadenosine phosphosulfate reductase